MEATEKLAADTLLNRGVRMKVRAPFWLRLLGRKHLSITISAPYEGTLLRIASYFLSTGLKPEDIEAPNIMQCLLILQEHGKAISRAVAAGWLNSYWLGKLFIRPAAFWLRWNCKSEELLTIAYLLLANGGISAFIDTIRLIRQTKITTPKHLSQATKGS